MRRVLSILIILFPFFALVDSNNEDYDIYSAFLREKLQDTFDGHFEKVIIINQYENRYDDLLSVAEYDTDSLSKYQLSEIYFSSSSEELTQNLIENKGLRELIKELYSDFDSHPKIDIKLLSIERLELDTITMDEYVQFFGKNFRRVGKGWKTIEKKFGTRLVIELSKIKYKGNFALFYFGYHCGELCGGGDLIFLEKENGKWQTLGELRLWNS